MDPFLRMVSRLEVWLMRVAALCLAALVVSQGWLVDGDTRRWLAFADPADGPPVEGRPAPAVMAAAAPVGLEVALRVEGRRRAPGAAVMVNGRWTATFDGDVVIVPVEPGDRLSIDARGYREPLAFRILRVSPGISRPAAGQRVVTADGVADLGPIVPQSRPVD